MYQTIEGHNILPIVFNYNTTPVPFKWNSF